MTAKRIALVPYEPGQEPEGMVSSLDPSKYTDSGLLFAKSCDAGEHREALAAAVRAAKRDPWEEWREAIAEDWRMSKGNEAQLDAFAATLELAEAIREALRWCGPPPYFNGETSRVMGILRAALRKTGAPVDEPESAEDSPASKDAREHELLEVAFWEFDRLRKRPGMPMSERDAFKSSTRPLLSGSATENAEDDDRPCHRDPGRARALHRGEIVDRAEDVPPAEERNRRQRAGLCRLCGASRGGASSYWCGDCLGKGTADDYCQNHAAMLAEYLAEDVPELWVSREDGGWADAWGQEPTWRVLDGWGVWEGRSSWRIPRRFADALALKVGDCRRVTRDEYERFFRPVLDLPPSERYAALERMVP